MISLWEGLADPNEYGVLCLRGSTSDDQIVGVIIEFQARNPDGCVAILGSAFARHDSDRIRRAYVSLCGHGYGGWVTGP